MTNVPKSVNIIVELSKDITQSIFYLSNSNGDNSDSLHKKHEIGCKFNSRSIYCDNCNSSLVLNIFIDQTDFLKNDSVDLDADKIKTEPSNSSDELHDIVIEPECFQEESVENKSSIGELLLKRRRVRNFPSSELKSIPRKHTLLYGRIEVPPQNIVLSTSNRKFNSNTDYEELYWEKHDEQNKSLPYFEIMSFSNSQTIYFLKMSEGNKLYMTNFDLREPKCDICGHLSPKLPSLLHHRKNHFINKGTTTCCGCKINFGDRQVLMRHVLFCPSKHKLPHNKIDLTDAKQSEVECTNHDTELQDVEMCDEDEEPPKQRLNSRKSDSKRRLWEHQFFSDSSEESDGEENSKSKSNMKKRKIKPPRPMKGIPRKELFPNMGRTDVPDENIIHSKLNKPLLTHEDYEELYWEKRRNYDKVLPYFEIMQVPNGITLYFMKFSRNNAFYMTNFDFRPLKCDLCGTKASDMTAFFNHRNLHFVDRGQTNCTPCGRNFNSREEAIRHASVCPLKEKLTGCKCKHCGKTYSTIKSLRKHEKDHVPSLLSHSRQPQICEYCSKSLPDVDRLRVHLRRVHQIDPYECHHCSSKYGTRQDITRHVITKHFPWLAPLSCHVCAKPFMTPSMLQSHVSITHDGNKFETCTVCGKTVAAVSIRSHMKVHRTLEERSRFYCEVCGKLFFSQNSLDSHGMQHKPPEEWPWQCNLCNKRFPLKGRYQHHMKAHAGNLPTCTVCSKTFHSKQYLNDHMNLHTGQKPYQCKVCEKSFADRSCMRSHLKQHESSMGVKLVLSTEEARLKRHGLLDKQDQL